MDKLNEWDLGFIDWSQWDAQFLEPTPEFGAHVGIVQQQQPELGSGGVVLSLPASNLSILPGVELMNNSLEHGFPVRVTTPAPTCSMPILNPASQLLKNIATGSVNATTTLDAGSLLGKRRLRCDHPVCNKTFCGPWELNRHKAVHKTELRRFCPVVGCNRAGRKPFTRIDKWRLHIHGHGEDAMLRCPVDGCTVPSMPLVLLSIHLQVHTATETRDIGGFNNAYGYGNEQKEFWSKLADGRICPLSPCHKALKDTNALQNHLRNDHDERCRLSQASVLLRAGIEPTLLVFICPVCTMQHADVISFEQHVLGHMADIDHVGRSMIANAWLFRGRLDTIIDVVAMLRTKMLPVRDWSYPFTWRCSECPFQLQGYNHVQSKNIFRNHAPTYIYSDAVRRVRSDILRIIPYIEHHPVFDDLRHPQDRAISSNGVAASEDAI